MYAPDGNHPSMAGTYLQGLIIASSMTGETLRCRAFADCLQGQHYLRCMPDMPLCVIIVNCVAV